METVRSQQHDDTTGAWPIRYGCRIGAIPRKRSWTKPTNALLCWTVRATGDGFVLPPPPKPEPKVSEKEQLPTWSGNPFDGKNSQAVFAESDLLCLVGDPQRLEAVLVIDQADIDLVSIGVEADIKIDSAKLETFSGKIRQISEMDMKETPENLSTQVARAARYGDGRLWTTSTDQHFVSSSRATG